MPLAATNHTNSITTNLEQDSGGLVDENLVARVQQQENYPQLLRLVRQPRRRIITDRLCVSYLSANPLRSFEDLMPSTIKIVALGGVVVIILMVVRKEVF